MDDLLTGVGSAPAPREPQRQSRGLVFRLYTSNPFYVISADLVFVGLRMSFDTHGKAFETWALMLGLVAYTALLAATACWLIRRAGVWDDARSLLLLVVMMFLAISVSFDNTLTGHPTRGTLCFLGGLLFAVLVSEGLLRGIRLVLPLGFRVPYYLILSLFFVYPLALSRLPSDPESSILMWALFGFPTLAGVLFLTLLPAVRRGPSYLAGNGSPWPWPLYPWVLFGLLAAAVAARSSYLCVSFHFVQRTLQEPTNSIFGPYFLVPFLLALNLLLLEAGLVARSRRLQRAALVVPFGLIVLATLGHRSDFVYRGFLETFMTSLGGSPLFLTTLAAVGFLAFAAVRSVPWASEAFAASLVVLSVVTPESITLRDLRTPTPWPIVAIAALEAVLAYRRRESWRSLLAAAGVIVAIGLVLPEGMPIARRFVIVQLALVAVLVLGAILDDWLGRLLQQAGAVGLFLGSAAALLGVPQVGAHTPQAFLDQYAFLSILVALGYGLAIGNRLYLRAAAAMLALWLALVGWKGYLWLRHVVAGLDLIAWGLASFVVAALISLKKAGLSMTQALLGKRPQNEL